MTDEAPAKDLNGPKTIIAEYYLIRSETEDSVLLSKHTDTLRLEVKGNKWQITDIHGVVKSLPFTKKQFDRDFSVLKQECPNLDALELNQVLKRDSRYPWLPTEKEILSGAKKASKRFNLSAAKDLLTKYKSDFDFTSLEQ